MKKNAATLNTTQNRTTSHSMEIYCEEMNRFELLSREEEVELGIKIQKDGDPEARERMINANLRLVVKIANEYSMYGLPVEDLVSEGNIGLMKATEKFDPSYKVRFSTYAAWWIKQAIKRALGNQSRTIRLPLHVVQKLRELDKAEQELSVELSRDPEDDEFSHYDGLSRKKVSELRRVSQPVVSIDDHLSDDGSDGHHLAVVIPDDSAPDPVQSSITNETNEHLNEALETLNPRERDIMISRFGLGNREPMTLEQLGVIYGVSRERIRQVQLAAFDKLSAAIKSLEGPVRNISPQKEAVCA